LLNPESGAAVDYPLANACPFFLRHVRACVPVCQALCQVFGNALTVFVGLLWHLPCSHRRSRICICTRKNVTQEKSTQGRHCNSLHEGFFPLYRDRPGTITTERPSSPSDPDPPPAPRQLSPKRVSFAPPHFSRTGGQESLLSGQSAAAGVPATAVGTPGSSSAPVGASTDGISTTTPTSEDEEAETLPRWAPMGWKERRPVSPRGLGMTRTRQVLPRP
jgi:hypothetical protein